MPSRALLRFLLGTTALAVWTVAILYATLRGMLASQETSHAATVVQAARGRLAGLVEREVGLVQAMADDPALQAWSHDEGSPVLKQQAFASLNRFRKLLRSTEAFVALDASLHFYFLDEKANQAEVKHDYVLRRSEKADEWYFSPTLDQKPYRLNVDQDRELKLTRLWINAAIPGPGHKVGAAGSGLDLEAFLDAFYGTDPAGDTVLLMSPQGGLQLHPNRQYTLLNAKVGAEQGRITLQSLIRDFEARTRLEAALKDLKAHPDKVATLKVPFEQGTAVAGLTYLPDLDWYLVALCRPASRLTTHGLAFGALGLGFAVFTLLGVLGVRALTPPPEPVKPPEET